jgi:hypothetical protein
MIHDKSTGCVVIRNEHFDLAENLQIILHDVFGSHVVYMDALTPKTISSMEFDRCTDISKI